MMDKFKQCWITQKIEDEIRRNLPQFVFYENTGISTRCYCTACDSWYIDSPLKRKFQSQSNYKHNEFGVCTACGEDVQFKAMHYGKKSYRHRQNFAVFYAIGGNLLIRCFTAYQFFTEDSLKPDFTLEEITRYHLSPKKAIQYMFHWKNGWIERSTPPKEPVFCKFMSRYKDRSYITINEACIQETFLKYCVTGLPMEIDRHYIITYLCRCTIHPNLEYLMKGGFFYLGMEYVIGTAGVRINWRSNNLLKMLHLDRTELKYCFGKTAAHYRNYLFFKNRIFHTNSQETIRYFEKFGIIDYLIIELHSRICVPFRKIMDYIEKQSNEHSIGYTSRDWLDYLKECQQLRYDLTDFAVSMPKHLHDAHQRTMQIMQVEADKKAEKLMKESNQKRTSLPFIDEKMGLKIVVPQSIDEIIAEGRVLSHCVGGYAERHAKGKLHILFLRKINAPNVPYYTMEVSTEGKIIQCRGYKNNIERNGGRPKPPEIQAFEDEYQKYLQILFDKSGRKPT